MILQVHDEILIEALKEQAKEISLVVKKEMEEVVSLDVPLVCNINIGKTWYDTK